MLEELLNSKMFWLIAAAVAGLAAGAFTKRLIRSKYGLGAFAMPVIGVLLTTLMLKFVRLNVEYFDVRYTLLGIGGMFITALLFGYLLWKYNDHKIGYWYSMTFIYSGLAMVIFYVFYKPELKINISSYPATKDIYLLLKKENAGYYEINEQGIGYVGSELFVNGFRPKFEGGYRAGTLYESRPYTVEIPTKFGVAHALWFKSSTVPSDTPGLNLDELIERGSVKADELKFGNLKEEVK